MQDLRNLMVFPEIVPEYHQKHGREYCNPGHPEVTWKFIKQSISLILGNQLRRIDKLRMTLIWEKDLWKKFYGVSLMIKLLILFLV